MSTFIWLSNKYYFTYYFKLWFEGSQLKSGEIGRYFFHLCIWVGTWTYIPSVKGRKMVLKYVHAMILVSKKCYLTWGKETFQVWLRLNILKWGTYSGLFRCLSQITWVLKSEPFPCLQTTKQITKKRKKCMFKLFILLSQCPEQAI